MHISPLRVGNEDFLVTSMIERCPKSMMLRELVKNALEAAANAQAGRVEIAPVSMADGRKLSIWNSGPGMNAAELDRMCDIASSIGKQNGLDQNFGMGAKVASLPSNPLGIRYRSCKSGRVHQVVMGKSGAAYGRLHQSGASGEPVNVLDVTEQAAADGRPVGIEWTEVVLLGARIGQDTVSDPYNGDPVMSAGWISQELYARFHTLPPGIALILRDGCNITGGDREFLPIGARIADFERYEAVAAERGIVLHYFYDAPDPEAPNVLLSARGALQPARSSGAIVHRGEMYDLRPPWAWLCDAPVFGLPFGARNFSVHVQLPDDFPLVPDGYRQFLRHSHNLQEHVRVLEFAPLVLRHRPEWLLELLRKLAPDARHTEPLHGELTGLFRTLGVRRRWWPPAGVDHAAPAVEEDAAELADAGDGVEYEVAPQIMLLRDKNDIRERGMENKAARFYEQTHQLFVNTTYAGFSAFREVLEREFAAVAEPEQMRQAALIVTEQILIRQLCRKLAFGMSKRGSWHHWEVDQAISMYSLTLAVDDNTGLLGEARAVMTRRFGEVVIQNDG